MQEKMHKHLSVELLGLVCDRSKSKSVQEFLKDQHIFFNLVMLGKGTATSKVLKYLGIGDTEKAVLFCIAPAEVAKECCQMLSEKLQLEEPGHGILFRTKLSEGCYHKPVVFVDEENGEKVMASQEAYNLVMIIANRGYSDEVMDTARAAGANGGTILHVRGGGSVGMEKFFGMTIAPDKEMIMIVAKDEITEGIMAAIANENGPESDAAGVSFAIPVSYVNGIRDYTNEAKAVK